eukprot:scaffold76358_cov69-Phaeocystis_antarctica.AAC.1
MVRRAAAARLWATLQALQALPPVQQAALQPPGEEGAVACLRRHAWVLVGLCHRDHVRLRWPPRRLPRHRAGRKPSCVATATTATTAAAAAVTAATTAAAATAAAAVRGHGAELAAAGQQRRAEANSARGQWWRHACVAAGTGTGTRVHPARGDDAGVVGRDARVARGALTSGAVRRLRLRLPPRGVEELPDLVVQRQLARHELEHARVVVLRDRRAAARRAELA